MADNRSRWLPKGRIFEEAMPLLRRAGIVPLEDPESTRKLIIATTMPDVRMVVVRATDVPTYVQYGAAELGMAGKDVLLEHGGAGCISRSSWGSAAAGCASPCRSASITRAPCVGARVCAWPPSTWAPRASFSPARACMST